MKYYIHSTNRFCICCLDMINRQKPVLNGLTEIKNDKRWKSTFTLIEALQYLPFFKQEFHTEIITIKVWE